MDIYLKKNHITNILDARTFPKEYDKLPGVCANKSWGYGDKELFRRYLQTKTDSTEPYCDLLLTVSTHTPYLINDQDKYLKKFESRMEELHFDEKKKRDYRHYKYQFASVLCMDDAVRYFIEEYSKRPDFNNTVLMITGDHCMSELPLKSKIDQYHVPFLIYSPLVKERVTFSYFSSHFDITPSILQWLKNNYTFKTPAIAHWMGTGLDTARQFRNIHAYPIMKVKSQLDYFIMGNYMMADNLLFSIGPDMNLTLAENKPGVYASIRSQLNQYRKKNDIMITSGQLMPDSIFYKYSCR